MTESRKQTDRLRQLQELRAFLDTQIEELTAREDRQLELCCSADKTLAGAGEPVLLCGVVHNSGCEAVEDLHLEFRLPEGLRLLPEGKNCPCCRRLPVPVLDLARLAPGETRALSVRVVAEQLPAENPLQVFLDCTADGQPCPGASLSLWLTDRSCSRKQAGCGMADALAQWSLAQLFGLSECEIALLLEYLQEHRETLLGVAAGSRCDD